MTSQVNGLSEYEKELTPKQQKYIATYIQRVYLELQKVNTEKQLDSMPSHLGLFWLKTETPLGLLKHVMSNAMNRKNLICDYKDAELPKSKKGKCESEYHDELSENGKNPPNQKLELVLDYDEDSNKFIPNSGNYFCKKCVEDLQENAEGYVSCDMEDYEPN